MGLRRLLLPILVTALGVIPVTVFGVHAQASSIDVEAVIWQFTRDYPGADGNDLNLPIKTVYVKTHDGTDWMSTYDSHPKAVSGPDSLRNLIQHYSSQGIDVVAWFVPYGSDIEGQLQRAREVIDAGVKGLVADVEPYPGFCHQDCAMLAEHFWKPLRAQRPSVSLGVTYDPRSDALGSAAVKAWLSVADMAAPECYWETFSGQGVWGDPGGCVMQSYTDLRAMTPGRNVEFAPMLQGNASAAGVRFALDTAVSLGASRASLWRRGVVPSDVWNEIRAYLGEPNRPCWVTRSDNCLFKEYSDPRVWLIQGGARFHIPSEDALYSMGYDWQNVHWVPDGFAQLVPLVPGDGTLLRETGLNPVHVVYAGARFWIPNMETFSSLGFDWGAVRVIPSAAISQIPEVPVDHSRFIELGEPEQFTFVAGRKLHLSPAMLDQLLAAGHGQALYVLWPTALDPYISVTFRLGDTSCDELVNAVDALHVLRGVAGLPNLGVCGNLAGDVDCDSDLDAVDALKILRWVAGLGGPGPAPTLSSPQESGVSESSPASCVAVGEAVSLG